eukprot:PhM_4_TR8378/c6_g1_i1/m.65936
MNDEPLHYDDDDVSTTARKLLFVPTESSDDPITNKKGGPSTKRPRDENNDDDARQRQAENGDNADIIVVDTASSSLLLQQQQQQQPPAFHTADRIEQILIGNDNILRCMSAAADRIQSNLEHGGMQKKHGGVGASASEQNVAVNTSASVMMTRMGAARRPPTTNNSSAVLATGTVDGEGVLFPNSLQPGTTDDSSIITTNLDATTTMSTATTESILEWAGEGSIGFLLSATGDEIVSDGQLETDVQSVSRYIHTPSTRRHTDCPNLIKLFLS